MRAIPKALFFLTCCCLLLTACASAPRLGQPGEIVIGNVPFYPQEDHQCGPASLAGVLNYEGLHTTPEEIAREIFSSSAGGTLTLDMVLYARRKGFSADEQAGTLQGLKEKIDAGHPVLVMVDYGFMAWQANHFMVVVGYDRDGLVVNSGKKEHEFISNDKFLGIWRKTGFWSLAIKE